MDICNDDFSNKYFCGYWLCLRWCIGTDTCNKYTRKKLKHFRHRFWNGGNIRKFRKASVIVYRPACMIRIRCHINIYGKQYTYLNRRIVRAFYHQRLWSSGPGGSQSGSRYRSSPSSNLLFLLFYLFFIFIASVEPDYFFILHNTCA